MQSLAPTSPRPKLLASVLQRALSSQGSLGFILLIGFVGFFQIFSNLLLVAVLAAISFKELYRKVDTGLPLLELANLVAVLQWTIGPALSYFWGIDHYRYHMYVPESTYFSYVLPATCAFSASILGFGLFAKQENLLANLNRDFFFRYGIYLLLIAVAAELLTGSAPVSVQFFFHLLSQLRYVAAVYFLLSRHPYGIILALLATSSLFVNSKNSGMFHDLLLWLALIFCIWFPTAKWLHYRKAIIFALGAISVFAIQVVKQDYRERLKSGDKPSLVLMAVEYLSPSGKAWEKDVLSLALVRLNQGWIVSAVMANVPLKVQFANGETVTDAFVAIAPRFLLPNKAKAGGRDNFRKYTGLPIGENTSMCICVLGEAYANFGEFGGIAFMGLFGAGFALYYSRILKWVVRHPDFLFWIPLIFYQAIKAETDLVVIANQIVKGSIVAFAGYWAIHRFFPPEQFIKTPMLIRPSHRRPPLVTDTPQAPASH
jgi:hypothetical protein